MLGKLLTILLILQTTEAALKRYDGDQVFRIVPINYEQLSFVGQFIEMPSDSFDFWRMPSKIGEYVDLRVAANHVNVFKAQLNANNIPYTIAIDDVQQLIDETEKPIAKKQRGGKVNIVGTFPELADLYTWMDDTCKQHSDMASCGTYGQSYENRTLAYMKIGAPSASSKKVIVIESTIHAREWLAMATTVYLVDKMLNQYNTDATVKRMMDTYDWIIIPTANPDGYEYSKTSERLWRKTRSPTNIARCVGVDPNRNWDHNWSSKFLFHFL